MTREDELIGMYYSEILRYCLWHAPNHSLAEDATQETFLKVIHYFDRYTHKGKFKSLVYSKRLFGIYSSSKGINGKR